jgi:hypothetical protein
MANQKVQDALKKFQDTKSKEHEKTLKQINKQTQRGLKTNTKVKQRTL